MKTFILIISVINFFFAESENSYSKLKEETLKVKVLKDWVKAHNSGSETEIRKFILKHYQKEWLSEKNIAKHIKFYMTIYNDFGVINPEIYKTEEDSKTKLKVQFLKKGISQFKKNIPKTDILSVEIDVDLQKNKLDRGLGLAPLICARPH